MLKVIDGGAESNQAGAAAGVARSPIDEIVREGARRMLAAALQAEVAAYIEQFADELDADGLRLVVRNGYHNEREVMTSSGAVAVRAPRVNDRRVDPETGESKRFSSAILPAWCRRSPQISEVLPLLYLHGLSTGDFGPALEQFLGSGTGLSSASITRLTTQWQDEARAFAQCDLSGVDYAYLRADGIHVNVRLDEARLCLLVLIGVRTDGRKELVALTDGYREATESWADLLRDCRHRGMRAPVLAIGDGALGFWGALREVFPQTREQRCWLSRPVEDCEGCPPLAGARNLGLDDPRAVRPDSHCNFGDRSIRACRATVQRSASPASGPYRRHGTVRHPRPGQAKSR
jgi:putative transposase